MTPHIITITGPSRCGKSKVVDSLFKISKNESFADFRPVLMPKFTTRAFRDNEIKLIKEGARKSLDVLPVVGEYNDIDGYEKTSLNKIRMEAFKAKRCDLAYEQYGNRYGLRLADLYDRLKEGETPIIILNDVRTVEDIKVSLGKQCFSMFIFREVPNIENYLKQGRIRHEDEKETRVRFEKAAAIYRIYIENIHIFDKLLLNIQDGPDELEKMLSQLVNYLCSPSKNFK